MLSATFVVECSCETTLIGARISHGHGRVKATGDFFWFKSLVGSKDTVERSLPHHKPVEEVGSEDLPDLHNDCTDEPVEKVWEPFAI